MRYALATALLAALVCAGCKKPQGPQTIVPPAPKPAAGGLKPLEPLPAEPMPLAAKSEPSPLVNPAPSPDNELASSVTPAPEPGRFYVVKKGDTLWKIATKVYGNGQRHRDILAANPGLQPTKMKVGQKLVLPEK